MKDRKTAGIIVVAMAVAVAVWRFACMPYMDDFAYMHKVLATCDSDFWGIVGGRISGFEDAVESIVNHWLFINGRLANLLMILSVVMPQWLVNLSHGVAVGAMIWLVMLCSGTKPLPWTVAAISLVMWKWFPWSDFMMSSDFMFNYPWACVAMLGYAYLFLNVCGRRFSTPGAIAVAFAAGWMHEGFSIPLCCASAVVIFFSEKDKRKQRLLMFVALVAGTALCVFAPSTLMRVDRTIGELSHNYPTFILKTLLGIYPIYIYLIVAGIVMLRCGCRHIFAELLRDMFWLIVLVVNVVIVVVIQVGSRGLWAADAALLVAVVGLLYRNFDWCRKPHYIATGCLMTIAALFITELIRWQNKIGEEQREIISRLESTRQPFIYMDVTQDSDLPWWTLGIPHDYVNAAGTGLYIAHSLTQCNINQTLLVAPARFEDKIFNQWDKIPGNNLFRGEYPVIYAPDSIPEMRLRLTLGEAEPALSPPALLLQNIMGASDCEAEIDNIFRCVTAQGDTIYRYYLNVGRDGRYRDVTRIDVIE